MTVSTVSEKVAAFRGKAILAVISTAASVTLALPFVGAINWTEITEILDGVADSLFPSLITLITAAVPIIIVVTVVGFVVGFLDKILGLLKM